MTELPQITVEELAQRLADPNHDLQLVDVRESGELATAQIADFIHLPLSEAEQWSQNIEAYLDRSKETFVLCHHGMRSAQMTGWLIQQGFSDVKNISGGINAYSLKVDPSVPQY